MLKSATYLRPGLLALAFAAGIAAGGPAASEPASTEGLGPDLTAFVQYRDLDLTTDPGRAELQARVQMAARRLCGERDGAKLWPAMTLKCEIETRARAADMLARSIAEANGRAYAATPADQVAVTAAAKGP
jgi:UrcA family protein